MRAYDFVTIRGSGGNAWVAVLKFAYMDSPDKTVDAVSPLEIVVTSIEHWEQLCANNLITRRYLCSSSVDWPIEEHDAAEEIVKLCNHIGRGHGSVVEKMIDNHLLFRRTKGGE